MIKPLDVLPLIALFFAVTAATAADPIDSAWPEVARAQDGDCELS